MAVSCCGRAVLSAGLVLSVVSAAPASAQGMAPPRGAGDVSVVFQSARVDDHLLLDHRADAGHIFSQAVLVDFSVGLGRRFSLDVSVPIVAARYDGAFGHTLRSDEVPLHPTFTFLDDGQYHGGLQDLRVELRYALHHAGVHIMPFFTVVWPTRDYEFLGHSAIGRGTREAVVGVGLTRLLTPWIARGFVQAHVSEAFQEEVAGLSLKRTHMNLEGGYFVTPDLAVFGVAIIHLTHGGIDIRQSPRAELSGEFYINHDRIQREQLLNLGAGATYVLSERLTIFGSVTHTVWGINGHSQAYALTIGVSRSFGGPGVH